MGRRFLAVLLLALAAPLAFAVACGGSVTTEDAGAPALGGCGKRCATAADCCSQPGSGCPGAYPFNWTCDEGVCRIPTCQSSADCASPWECHPERGAALCFPVCGGDSDCPQGEVCKPQFDDGAKACLPSTLPKGCQGDGDCSGGLHCMAPACGCFADADCKASGLDVCVHDFAHRYPPSGSAPGK